MNVKLFTYHFPLSLSSLSHYQAEFKCIEKGLFQYPKYFPGGHTFYSNPLGLGR